MITEKKQIFSYIKIIGAMLIWGTLALFVNNINLPSSEIVLGRVAFGLIFLSVVFLIKRQRPDKKGLKKYGFRLFFTGIIMGLNWVALFEAYRYVDVSIATLCYYCAPVIVIIGSGVMFKEKIGVVKILCMVSAAVGMFIVTGASMGGSSPVKGVIFGLASAALYACVTLSNKSVKGMSGLEITIIQLIGAGVSMLIYVLFTHKGAWIIPPVKEMACLVILGFVHTGIALFLYFSAIQELKAQSVALCSYVDPVSALIFAAIFLGDKLLPLQILGAVLILGGAVVGETLGNRKSRTPPVNHSGLKKQKEQQLKTR